MPHDGAFCVSSMNKYYLWVIGCQQNEHDGKCLDFALTKIGFERVDITDADLVIILACSVRQTAIDRILGKVKDWEKKKIIVLGCVLESDRKKFEKRGLLVCPDNNVEKFVKLVGINELDKFKNYLQKAKETSAFVPIIYGCNNFCSYCAVPYTRGRERSRSFNDVVYDVKNLIATGHSEIMLLGQNVNSYKYDFAKLMQTLNDLDGNFIISFISNHPKDMSDDIIAAVATLPKIKKEIHLPLQSGSDKILKAMNRPYSVKQYLNIINKIHKANPKIKITTDVIVGFPGETEADFQKTVEVFKRVKYSLAYINKYSPRVGTVAYKLGDPISWAEKQRRWHVLDKVVNAKA